MPPYSDCNLPPLKYSHTRGAGLIAPSVKIKGRYKMKFRTMFVVMAVFGVMFLLGGQGAVMADERSCAGTLGSITVDNLRVPAGKTCKLNGTRVQGTIKVENNATLVATNVRVVGNVQGEGAKMVKVLGGSTVGGSIQVVQGRAAVIDRSNVNGDIQFDDNSGSLKATRNDVGGNIQAIKNTGGVVISNNTVDANLQCKENRPAPTGSGNIVHGSKEDQCARL